MDSRRFDALTRRMGGVRLSRAAALRGVGAGALTAVLAAAGVATPGGAKHKKKKKTVCLCPTADATGCSPRKTKKQQARKLASQACNYAGKCQPGVVGPQCRCPSGQTRCGQNCVNLQTDTANCGACGKVCATAQRCRGGACVPPPCGQGGPCLVFATSTLHGSNLKGSGASGLTTADAICQGLADAEGLPGDYKAWLSDATASPSTRFMHSTGPYTLVDGTVIANDWADLTTCETSDPFACLDHPIDRTESGSVIDPVSMQVLVWTGTDPDGTASGVACAGWSSDEGWRPGGAGDTSSSVSDWTDVNLIECGSQLRLYCFQQS